MSAIPKGDPIALAEVQLKVNGPRYSFTYPSSAKFKSIVMRFDEVAGEGAQVKDQRLDFKGTRSVMVKKDLYVFQEGAPVSVKKYTDFNDAELLQKTPLATLPRNDHLQDFAVTNVANTLIVLSGGSSGGVKSAKTFGLIVKVGKW